VGSEKTITAIFSHNLSIVMTTPTIYISSFVARLRVRRVARYLAYLDAVVAAGDTAVAENQYEVMRLLSTLSKAESEKVFRFFVPTSHSEYKRKIALMEPFLDKKDINTDELPPEIAYHLDLLSLLSKLGE
jgi:hypothetical protein